MVLRPSIAALTVREEHRRVATGKVAYRDGYTPAENDGDLGGTRRGLGLWLDTSDQTAEETVSEILCRQDEALVD